MKSKSEKVKFLMSRISASDFSKNSLLLIGGTVASQLIPVGISPILTRLYSPLEFGVLALFVSVAKIISVFSTGRYEPAIVLPEEDKDGVNLMAVSILLSFSICTVAGVIIFFFQSKILTLLNAQSMGGWLLWIAPTAFLMAVVQVFYYWLTRKKAFKSMSYGKVFQAAATGGVQLGAWNGALITGNIVGQIAVVIKYVAASFKGVRQVSRTVSWERMKYNMKEYRNFPLITSIHRFFDLLQSNVLISVISSLFSSAVLGFYSLTTRTLLAPAALIGSAVGNVFYQKAAELYQDKIPVAPLVKKILLGLSIVGIAGFGLLYFFAEILFSFAFGEEWVVCGTYTRILAPWLLCNFVSSPVSGIVNILGKQRMFFVISALGNGVAVSLFLLIGTLMGDVFWSLVVFSGTMTLYTLIYIFSIYSAIKESDKALL